MHRVIASETSSYGGCTEGHPQEQTSFRNGHDETEGSRARILIREVMFPTPFFSFYISFPKIQCGPVAKSTLLSDKNLSSGRAEDITSGL